MSLRVVLLCNFISAITLVDVGITHQHQQQPAPASSHPIVIVNNNHNNHSPVNTVGVVANHFILNGSELIPADGDMDTMSVLEFTTGREGILLPANVLTLDEPINSSSSGDPFVAGLYFPGDQQVAMTVNLNGNSIHHISNSTTPSSLQPSPVPKPYDFASPSPSPAYLGPGSGVASGPVYPAPTRNERNATASSVDNLTPAPSQQITTIGSDGKLRWIDYRGSRPPPAFPPRVPGVHGIPSGFRNPPQTSAPPSTTPSYGAGSLSSPQMVHNFGPSSSNPVGFAGSVPAVPSSFPASNVNQDTRRRPMPNITRVEHIAAECSDDYMKVTIHYNGTFTGLVYSSGYVHDPNCIYVNGTGRNHYEFFIRLNQCGTLGRQEMYHPKRPGEVRRRDQVMWNTLSIQYNPLIEEEWDEHYRVTCEYGSDFWKTVTFPAVNVEVNTGSPVVFTINPPQCQMEVRRGFGTAGSRTSGPVTVGDPLTLLIHMKSEKAGFDILVKNCIAHNGAQQRLQLIDPNGCVTNEKLISPFRGTYNTDDGHQVSLYAYLKAFRFTGSPALYLECDIHMCHNKCPPQRCYWRNLSKRSARSLNDTDSKTIASTSNGEKPVMSESISLFQALEVRHEPEENKELTADEKTILGSRSGSGSNLCFRPDNIVITGLVTIFILLASMTVSVSSFLKMRRIRRMYEMQSSEGSLYKNALSYDNLCYGNHFQRRRF